MQKQLGILLLVIIIALGFSGAVTAAESSSKTIMSSNNAQMHMTPGQMSQMMKMMKTMHMSHSQMMQMMQIMMGKNMPTAAHRYTR